MLDTGPLLDALILHHVSRYSQQSNTSSHKLLSHVNGVHAHPSARTEALSLLNSISVKLTTSHVIAEVNSLVTKRLKIREADLTRFWSGSIELLTLWNLDERMIQLLDLAGDAVEHIIRVGIVDTGLIRLAQQHGYILITNDEKTLAPLAWEQGVDCHILRNLLSDPER